MQDSRNYRGTRAMDTSDTLSLTHLMTGNGRRPPNSGKPSVVGPLKYLGYLSPAFLDANDAAIWSQVLAKLHCGSRT